VRQALLELGVEGERIAMYHLERGFHPEFVAAAQEMEGLAKKMGPSPMKGVGE
jgi:coenzyme F420-reducing hydrogenase delta subunit